MKDTEKAGIRQISSFVNGIQRDMDAVKKAIELDYNNGLAERSDSIILWVCQDKCVSFWFLFWRK